MAKKPKKPEEPKPLNCWICWICGRSNTRERTVVCEDREICSECERLLGEMRNNNARHLRRRMFTIGARKKED